MAKTRYTFQLARGPLDLRYRIDAESCQQAIAWGNQFIDQIPVARYMTAPEDPILTEDQLVAIQVLPAPKPVQLQIEWEYNEILPLLQDLRPVFTGLVPLQDETGF